jgi:porphobilinogen synthase
MMRVFSASAPFPLTRMRRQRYLPQLRHLVRETELGINDLVAVIFLRPGRGIKNPVKSMPGVFQMSCDVAAQEAKELSALGIQAVMLFGVLDAADKDRLGSHGWSSDGIVQQGIKAIKDAAPHLMVISDICACEYTDHGHCGAVDEHRGILDLHNDRTLDILRLQAESHARAGADILAPSGHVDGMVKVIRESLDAQSLEHVPILSYSMKYASGLYGPFREAAQGAPQFGDRRTYQADPANAKEALREVALDLAEGADMVMVKPASIYLDVIHQVSSSFPEVPCAAYHVSGEYSMIKAASQLGWIDETRVMLETLTSIKRAGARFIITYFAKDAARILQEP